ncbi:Fusaric acid cluster transcription factor FUB10 [Hyphodiscus hymeniophilus]|uniref:Fusaric acid cluster transcription factor FUB10 n=1 Tax=Hyphodiscus hymeniophilus TaxID=353542 RepID=A0A9P7AY78_9HELO|nr:Fusaric acid cluster transcription factor FUB10 [Hyphodiscus hymeniophilus]
MLPEAEKSSAESTVKRRACDECRQRKLACSKAPDGCQRCQRESIKCHYSEQKPMGRPRKRRMVENPGDEIVQDQLTEIQDPGLLSFSANDFDFDAALTRPYHSTDQPAALFPDTASELRTTKTGEGRVVWRFGDLEVLAGPPINFGDVDNGREDDSIPAVEPVPQQSTASNTSATDSENSPPQSTTASAPCSCLASMYLALASLQQFPTDIVSALKTVRGAAATAAYSLWCKDCGSVMLDTPTPPIESFQNTMLLGTILPIIANGYGRLLTMIDAETDQAVASGQMKTFRFHDYGGLCGRQISIQEAMICAEKEFLFNALEMPPAQWRTTVRALLRVDIYGHEQPEFKHKGLKDLVDEMELRQHTRHDMLDAQVADGTLDPTKIGHGFGHSYYTEDPTKCLGERTRGCIEILKMAKLAIDSLVIA